MTSSKSLKGRLDLIVDHSQINQAIELPDLDVNSRDNIYVTGSGKSKGSGLLQKAKGLLKGKSEVAADLIR